MQLDSKQSPTSFLCLCPFLLCMHLSGARAAGGTESCPCAAFWSCVGPSAPASSTTFPEDYLERVKAVHEKGGYGSIG